MNDTVLNMSTQYKADHCETRTGIDIIRIWATTPELSISEYLEELEAQIRVDILMTDPTSYIEDII